MYILSLYFFFFFFFVCSTSVIKAQSLNFIQSHYYMNFSLEEISLRSLVNHFSGSLQAGWTKWLLIVIVHSVAYIWAAFIQIWTICCVYWEENCMQIHLSEDLLNISTAVSSPSGWWKKKPGHGLAPFIVFYTESISFSPVFSWPWP